MNRYILASQSPRRRELLRLVLNDYEVIPAQGEEVVTSKDPAEAVLALSSAKALEVAEKVFPCDGDRMIVIGADTVVAADGEILGKPAGREDAARMISLLEGREHHVYTGVTVCWKDSAHDMSVENGDVMDGRVIRGTVYDHTGRARSVSCVCGEGRGGSCEETGTKGEIRYFSFCEETAVDVFPMNRGEIEGYISLNEPYDKAGAYGIQGAFSVFIRGIRGDYNNVVGLPAARLYHEMAERELL